MRKPARSAQSASAHTPAPPTPPAAPPPPPPPGRSARPVRPFPFTYLEDVPNAQNFMPLLVCGPLCNFAHLMIFGD